MNKAHLKKLILASYILSLILLGLTFFISFTYDEIRSLGFLLILKDSLSLVTFDYYLFELLALLIICFLWAFFLGFNSPIAIFSGIILGTYTGTIITVIGITLGSGLLYFTAQNMFRENISKLYNKRYRNIKYLFHDNELILFILYRLFIGIPFGLSNLLAILFNARIINFLLGTAIGVLPSIFIWASVGSGFDKVLTEYNELPSFTDIIKSDEVRAPLISFVIFIVIIFVLKKYLYRNKP